MRLPYKKTTFSQRKRFSTNFANPRVPNVENIKNILLTRGSFEGLGSIECALTIKAMHKTFRIMKEIDLSVIDQMYSAMLSVNESEETIKALRPKVEIAVQELIRQRGLPRMFKGIIPYHGFNIRVQRPRTYTWEQNTNEEVTSDPNHAIYVQQLELQRRINEQLKDMRADVKRTAEKLEKAHPESESIKYGLSIALMSA